MDHVTRDAWLGKRLVSMIHVAVVVEMSKTRKPRMDSYKAIVMIYYDISLLDGVRVMNRVHGFVQI